MDFALGVAPGASVIFTTEPEENGPNVTEPEADIPIDVEVGWTAPGTIFMVYPPGRWSDEQDEITDSIRYEAQRDGIEDYELLYMLAEEKGKED